MKDLIDTVANNFIKSLSKDEYYYCTHKDRNEYFGFSALHDLFDANVELLDIIEKLNIEAPSHNQKGWDFLNKCTNRINEKLKLNQGL
jgi:hypothetical protein